MAAYNGQAANLTKDALRGAATVVSVDARHAAWIRSIVGDTPAEDAVDAGLSMQEVDDAVSATGFLPEDS